MRNGYMSIVLFGGEKGGTGKTTLATNVAAGMAFPLSNGNRTKKQQMK